MGLVWKVVERPKSLFWGCCVSAKRIDNSLGRQPHQATPPQWSFTTLKLRFLSDFSDKP